MEGWSGPGWSELAKIEDQYVNWLRLDHFDSEAGQSFANRFPSGKISAIKEIRSITGSGLLESKRLAEIWERASTHKLTKSSVIFVPSPEEKDTLKHFGYLEYRESQSRDEKRSKRMLRPEGTKIDGCSQDHSLTVEWRTVGEYEIQIANFCPGCGKKLIYF